MAMAGLCGKNCIVSSRSHCAYRHLRTSYTAVVEKSVLVNVTFSLLLSFFLFRTMLLWCIQFFQEHSKKFTVSLEL